MTAEEMEKLCLDKNSVYRTNIIGAGEVNCAISVDMDRNAVHKTNSFFWDTKRNDVLGATALPFYGAFVSEEKCQLFGDVSGKRMLEIGCGSGESLQYLGERKAAELWGMDISNALAKAGFVIEQMIEESDDDIIRNKNSDFAKKAKMLPVTFIVKARKL